MKTLLLVLAVALAAGSVCSAFAQTTAAQSSVTPMVYVYEPHLGFIQAALGPNLALTCTGTAPAITCSLNAVQPTIPAQPTVVSGECYAVTAAQTAFTVKIVPAANTLFAVYKNGVRLMNLGGADFTISGAAVTLSTAQTAQPSDGVCFDYSHF